MTTNHQDPKTYLSNLVSKRGRSAKNGVFLRNAIVTVDSSQMPDYKVHSSYITPFVPPPCVDGEKWSNLLIQLRAEKWDQLPFTIVTDEGSYQFCPDGAKVHLTIFKHQVSVEAFEFDVMDAWSMLECVTEFAGSSPGEIKFMIGYVTKTWEDMVRDGEAEEHDLSY